MAPRRKGTASSAAAAPAEAAAPTQAAVSDTVVQEETADTVPVSDQADASGSGTSSVLEQASPEADSSQGELSAPMDVDSTEEIPSTSEVSKEVESLNELLAKFKLDDEEEDDPIVDGVDDPSKEDLQSLFKFYEGRYKRRAKMVGVIHARFNATIREIRRIRVDQALQEDATRKATAMKEEMLASLTQQCASLRKDMDSLKMSILQGYEGEEDQHSEQALQATESRPAKFSVKWDKNNPEHCALHRVFGEEYIPLIEGTNEVDYSKVKKRTFKDSPILDLNVSSLPVEDMVQEVAVRIVKFRDDFERWCRWHLSDDLMDKLAWDYMPTALSKVGLAKDYQELINELPIEKRTWKQVVVCLNKALKTELLEAHLADEVLTARPKVGETFLAFTQRLIPLVEAAKFPDDGCSVLIKALGNHLSDVGFQATIKEYGSFDEVKSIKKYLEFLTKTPGAMEGSKTDHTLYFIKKYGGKAGAQAASRSQVKPRSDYSDKAHSSSQVKRSSSDMSNKDRDFKKPRTGSRKPLCTYSKKSIAKKFHHAQEDCNHWQNDQAKKEREERSGNQSSQSRDSPKFQKTVGAFKRASEDTQMEGIELNKHSMFSSYSSLPYVPLKEAYAFKDAAPGDNRIAVPMSIMGAMCTALLDPGATTSLISKELADDLAIRYYKKPNDSIAMIEAGSSTQSIVTCDKVQLVCNKRSLECHVYVMAIEYYDFIVGMDLFARFGFAITGMAMPPAREEEFLWVPYDEKASLIPKETPEEERTPEFIKRKSEFLETLEPHLATNANIDPKSYCTLESMR
ncbi:hypothetical protein EC968_009151, partial [Mortierella alpina]